MTLEPQEGLPAVSDLRQGFLPQKLYSLAFKGMNYCLKTPSIGNIFIICEIRTAIMATFENHFSLVRNVTEKCVSVSTVAPMTNDYTL